MNKYVNFWKSVCTYKLAQKEMWKSANSKFWYQSMIEQFLTLTEEKTNWQPKLFLEDDKVSHL